MALLDGMRDLGLSVMCGCSSFSGLKVKIDVGYPRKTEMSLRHVPLQDPFFEKYEPR